MEHSAQLHSPIDAAELLAALGGQEEIAKFAPQSKQLSLLVAREARGGRKKGQDCIYQGMGLTNLLTHAERFKPRFDALCNSFVKVALKRGYDVAYQAVPVKSFDSAQAKVNVDYHGDPSLCNDLVRGTLLIKGPPGKDAICSAYGVLDLMLGAKRELQSVGGSFVAFKDRYQKPAGSYRDWLFIISIIDFKCELQVNFEAAIKIKQGRQHEDYELERMANRSLLDAAMRGVAKMVRIILNSKNCRVDCTDAHDFTALHYAARHGSEEMIQALLDAKADVLRVDDSGRLPIYHATLMRSLSSMELLVANMESRTHIDFALLADSAKNSLQSAWMLAANFFSDGSDVEDTIIERSDALPEESANVSECERRLVERLSSLVTRALSHIDDQLHAAAHGGQAHTCQLLVDKGAMIECWRFQPDVGYACTPLDQAIAAGSVATVKVLLAAGCGLVNFEEHEEYGFHEDFNRAASFYATHNMAPQLAALISTRNEADLPDMSEPVNCAIGSRAYECLLILQEVGVSVKTQEGDDAGLALHGAAGMGNTRAVKALLQMGLSANCQDVNARTPLQVSAAGGFTEVSQVLIEAKADINHKGIDGWTAAVRAGQRGQSLSLRQLYEANADLTIGSETAAWIAACNGHIHVIEYIWTETSGAAKLTVGDPSVIEIAEERNPAIAKYIKEVCSVK